MTNPEPATWSFEDVLNFVAPEGHHLHLDTDTLGIKATCSCGMVWFDLVDIQELWDVLRAHVLPLTTP